MVNLKPSSLMIGLRTYNLSKDFYPARATAFSGVSVSFGADSCMEHPEPSRAAISLWVPYNLPNFIPTLDEEVKITAQFDNSVGVRIFTGNIDRITLSDNHSTGYFINVSASDATAKAGRLRVGTQPFPSTSGVERLAVIRAMCIASGVEFFDNGTAPYSIPADIGGNEMVGVRVRAVDVDAVNPLEFYRNTAMSAGLTVGSVDNVITPNYTLRMPRVLDKNASGAFVADNPSRGSNRPMPVIPVTAIRDSAFALDTTQTVNQIKVNYFVRRGTATLPIASAYTAIEDMSMVLSTGSAYRTAPVTRVLNAENQVEDPSDGDGKVALPTNSALETKARAALAAQSVPQWRLTNGMQIVLKELPYAIGLLDLIEEAGRFGQIVRIQGAPGFIDQYQRVKGGRIILGEEPVIELELEPADYSGTAAPLNRTTAVADSITAAITIGDLKTISSETMRTIGAR